MIAPPADQSARRAENGFTLTEVLVVILILGILSAIAIPLFLSQQQKAFRAAVQTDLRNAANAIEDAATNHAGDYLASDIPLDTVLGPTTVITGSALGGLGGGGRISTAAVRTAESPTTLSFSASPKIQVWAEVLTRTAYCINAKHASMNVLWSYDSLRGRAVEGGCSDSSAVPGGEPVIEATPSTTAQPEPGTGELGGVCDPKDAECLEKQEAASYGCKVGDTECIEVAKKEEAIAEAKKYGCSVGDEDCVTKAKQKEAEALGCKVDDLKCLADATKEQQDAALAVKYGCKPGDSECLAEAAKKEAALTSTKP